MARRIPGRKSRQGGGGDYAELAQEAKRESRFPDTLSSICIVFEVDDAERDALLGHGGKSAASISRQIRQPLVDKLRAADLLVRGSPAPYAAVRAAICVVAARVSPRRVSPRSGTARYARAMRSTRGAGRGLPLGLPRARLTRRLQVREACSRDKDEMFVLVSASAKRQKHVAEIMGQRGLLKLRFRQQDEHGNIEPNEGAWSSPHPPTPLKAGGPRLGSAPRIAPRRCPPANDPARAGRCPFKSHLQPLYEPSREGTLFSSLTQLRILE
jgi:hypothetical protein